MAPTPREPHENINSEATTETNQNVARNENFNWEDFKVNQDELGIPVQTDMATTPGEASMAKCTKILNELCKLKKTNKPGMVMLVTATLLQKGATSPRTADAMSASISTVTLSVGEIRAACKKENITVRQLARGLKDKIADSMLALGEFASKGNLSKLALADIPDLSVTEQIWGFRLPNL